MSASIPRFYVYNKADQSYWEVANPTDPSEIEAEIKASRTLRAGLRAIGWISALVTGAIWLGIPDPPRTQGPTLKGVGMILFPMVASIVCITKRILEAAGDFNAAKDVTRYIKQHGWNGLVPVETTVPLVRVITVDIQESPLKEERVAETEWVEV